MRTFHCRQGTEEWDELRKRPTASEFSKFVTPARGDYSSQATAYAAKVVAKKLGVYQEPPQSFWMEWGTENEPNAKHAYTLETGNEIQEVGFVMPDYTDAYGCSPDGLIGDDGGIEVKCPAPETLIRYHAEGGLPLEHKVQVQSTLFITGRDWWDFYAWHPELSAFLIRVEPDRDYHAKIAESLLKLLEEIKRIEGSVRKMRHEIVTFTTADIVTDFGDSIDG